MSRDASRISSARKAGSYFDSRAAAVSRTICSRTKTHGRGTEDTIAARSIDLTVLLAEGFALTSLCLVDAVARKQE